MHTDFILEAYRTQHGGSNDVSFESRVLRVLQGEFQHHPVLLDDWVSDYTAVVVVALMYYFLFEGGSICMHICSDL